MSFVSTFLIISLVFLAAVDDERMYFERKTVC